MRRSTKPFAPWLSVVIMVGFPSHSAMIINVLKEKGFDRKHGGEG
jgi:hypothetical protein